MTESAEGKARARWGTQSGSDRELGEYSKGTFYIHSTNEHNHSVTARPYSREAAAKGDMPETVTLPPEIYAQIHQVVADPRTKYRNAQDFWRDAAVHRLHELDDMFRDGGFENFLETYRILHELVTMEREDDGMDEIIASYAARVERAVGDNNPHAVADIIRVARTYQVRKRHHVKWMKALAGWEREQERLEARQ